MNEEKNNNLTNQAGPDLFAPMPGQETTTTQNTNTVVNAPTQPTSAVPDPITPVLPSTDPVAAQTNQQQSAETNNQENMFNNPYNTAPNPVTPNPAIPTPNPAVMESINPNPISNGMAPQNTGPEINGTNEHIKSSNNKTRNIIFIVLAVIIIGIIGFVVYKQFFAKENKEDLNSIALLLQADISTKGLDQLDRYEKSFTVSNKPSNEQLVAMWYNFELKNTNYGQSITMYKEDIDKYFKETYNINLKEYPNITCPVDNKVAYTFDSSKGAYVPNSEKHYHYKDSIFSSMQGINSIKKNGSEYTLVLNKGFINYDDENIYADGNYKTKLFDGKQFASKTTGEVDYNQIRDYYEENYKTFKDTKPMYKYTFKENKKDKESYYYLTKYEVIK